MKNYFVALFLLCMIGCAPKVTILMDGQPVPGYSYIMSNPQTGITMEVISAKIVKKDEGGETVWWPEYSKVNKNYYVDPTDEYILITVKVKNLNKEFYELRENSYKKSLLGFDKWTSDSKLIYKGRLKYNVFDIRHEFQNNTFAKIIIEAKDKTGLRLIEVGQFSYKIIQPEERR